jgi:hypothetical protein
VAAQAKDQGRPVTVEPAVAPVAAEPARRGWQGLAQVIPHGLHPDEPGPEMLLFYARPVDAKTAVVMQMRHAGEVGRGGAVEEEIGRILSSVDVLPQ